MEGTTLRGPGQDTKEVTEKEAAQRPGRRTVQRLEAGMGRSELPSAS